MSKHALLSASSAHRWITCPPSARLCESCADTASEFARQGTDAHSLAEYKLKHLLGMRARDPTEDLDYYDAEMESCTDGYAAFVMEKVEEAKKICADPLVLVEQRLDYSGYVPEGFGTGDAVIAADRKLTVCDLKYGKGILVDAEENPQLMIYGLGALELFDGIYDIETVELVIYQPRRENISTYVISKDGLLAWARDILVPAAKLAYAGEGDFCAGDHCRFCKAKARCRKRAEYNLTLAQYDFAPPAILEDAEVEIILSKAEELSAWAADVKEYALKEALHGHEWKDWKLVAGRSVRRYVDEEAVAEAVSRAGYEPYEKKLLGITAMTAALGKKQFSEIIEKAGLIEKPAGKPVLVPVSDKRPALNTAKEDFKDQEE